MQKAIASTLDDSVALLKAFADPVRLQLLNLLGEGEVCVCHLREALELPQPAVSRQGRLMLSIMMQTRRQLAGRSGQKNSDF